MTADQSPPKKSAITISRIILVLILAGAVVALVMDFRAKSEMETAFAALEELHAQSEKGELTNEKGKERPIEDADIREIMRREPARSAKNDEGATVQQYDFGGVFYIHRITVTLEPLQFGGETLGPYEKRSVFRFGGK